MPDRKTVRSRRTPISHRIAYLGDLIDIVNPFGQAAARKAEANAGSQLAKDHQRMSDIDDLLRDHVVLAEKVQNSS